MNDRIFKALERAGLPESPIASLDYEQQLFALTPQTLVFQAQDDGPLQQVLLRDITRIHSDEAGTLRIETGSQTALTASLLGYDAGRVQRFFQVVRDTTARAKQLPAPPSTPAPVFFGKPAPTIPLAEQLAAAPRPQGLAPQGLAPLTPQPAPLMEAGSTIRISAQAPQLAPADEEGAASSHLSSQAVKIAAVRTPVASQSVTDREIDREEDSKETETAERLPSLRPERTEDAAVLARQRTELSPAVRLAQTQLLKRSRGVGTLSGTARVLALVLVLGSLGMGYVMWQKQSQHIPALWTVTIGIVTAVALLILAEVLRFLADLGAAVAETENSA